MNTKKIMVRQVDPAVDRSKVLGLLSEAMPEAATEGRFDWAYLKNPNGVASAWLAETADGEVVGTSAAFPRYFLINGKRVRALVLSDFAIASRFRTLGPAIALLRATMAPVDDGLYEFALDHPSASMLAVYKRLGCTELGHQTRYVRLLKLSSVAARRWGNGRSVMIVASLADFALRMMDRVSRVTRGLDVETCFGEFGGEFAEMSRALEERRAVVGLRCLEYLNWRYEGDPRFSYFTVAVRSKGKLIAYAILQRTYLKSWTIVEFVSPDNAKIEIALFRAVLDISHRYSVASLQASCVEGGAWCTILKRLGFVARERSTGPVVYSPRPSELTDVLTDGDQWWMTDGDRDG